MNTLQKTNQSSAKKAASSRIPISFRPLSTAMWVIALTIVGLGALAISTDYDGSIELKFGPEGGYLRINPSLPE